MAGANGSRRLSVFLWLAAVLAAACTGCSTKKKQPEPWIAPPHVRWSDIVDRPMPEVSNAYRLLQSEPTQGLFPAAIAVTRVSREKLDEFDSSEPPGPRISVHPRNETLRFNSAFDDLMAVAEVFPITQRTLGGGEAVPAQILAAYRALDARLGLIYAVNDLSPAETEVLAVLYNVRSGTPLACYHCSAMSLAPPEGEGSKDQAVNPWKTDSRALARRAFERLVHASLRELILRDEPAPLEDRSGWEPVVPPLRPEWPPTRNRDGR
jgi:hypothetical protein